MKHLNLRAKFLSVGLLAVVIPITIIGIVAVYESSKSISNLARDDIASIAESLAGTLEVGMNEQLMTVKNISFSNSVIAAAEKVAKDGEKNGLSEIALVQKELTKMKDAEGDRFSSILITGKNRIAFASSENGKMKGLNLAGRDYLDKAFKGTPTVGSVVFSRATGRVVCTAASPVYSFTGKEITGAVVIGMELKLIADIIDKIKIGKGGYAYIVSKDGIYITHPVKGKILKDNIFKITGKEVLSELIKNNGSGVVEYMSDGVQKVAAVSPVQATGWSIVATIPVEELYASARFTRNIIIIVGLVFLILASILFYFFARSLTLPMGRLVRAADRIASGDLSIQVAAETRQDEIGMLSRSFTFMIQSLKEKAEIAQKIAASDLTIEVTPLSDIDSFGNAFATMVEKLRTQTHQIIEGVNVLTSAGSEIMASVSQLTSGAAETATAVSETTTTVEEVKQTAEMASQKAKHVSEIGQRTAEISQNGLKSIEDTVNGMNRIRKQMESIADMVLRLSEQSQAIGEIIATVNDIAEQSNLLAVNASIEAAKAGEQGKGFAVVAQEIRSLAAQSKQATTQVRNILFDVQKAISSAVMATEQGTKAVEEGVRLSTQAGDSIDVLSESVTESTNAAIQIAASSQQQLIGMAQVVSAMENIRQSSIQTVSGTKQTEKAAHDLYDLGQRLQEIVKSYKV